MPVLASKDVYVSFVCVCVYLSVYEDHFSSLINCNSQFPYTHMQTYKCMHIQTILPVLPDPVEGRCGFEADSVVYLFLWVSMCVHVTKCVRAILLNSHKDTASYMTPSCVDLAHYLAIQQPGMFGVQPYWKAPASQTHTHSLLRIQPTPLSRADRGTGLTPKEEWFKFHS